MGTVYEAEQDNPRRTVALKVIRSGLVSAEHLNRFSHEAQISGRLQHSGIAQVYEAGRGIDGRPFFAMEFIRGMPLDKYARTRHLDLPVELLAHCLPYHLDQLPVHEVTRVIEQQEPSRLDSIDKLFRGDVAIIVAKALEKDKRQRYASAGDLASDIRRYLSGEGILAREVRLAERSWRWARRHPSGFAREAERQRPDVPVIRPGTNP